MSDAVDIVHAAIAQRLATVRKRPLAVGICGAQGSGKSTLAAALAERLDAPELLSLDDLYLTRAERQRLARDVHPLLATRGPPGTHDIVLGLATLDALDRGEPVSLPRFDKARDDRLPRDRWPDADPANGIVILEGWCVGARPQTEAALAEPINALEREQDADGRWRRFVNEALAGRYQRLFARIDLLVLLAAPGFEVVRGWRIEQEHALRARIGADAPGLMGDAMIARFVQHYERLTRHILAEMPERADLTLYLGPDRSVVGCQVV